MLGPAFVLLTGPDSAARPRQGWPAAQSPHNPPPLRHSSNASSGCSHLGPTNVARSRTGLACRLLPAWLPPSKTLLGPMALMSKALRAPLPVELGRWRPCEAERCGGEAGG